MNDTFRTVKQSARKELYLSATKFRVRFNWNAYIFFIENIYLILPICSKNAWYSGLPTIESIVLVLRRYSLKINWAFDNEVIG